ncbi:MAG: hypothetical protein PHF63_00775 [Herbinix sp.]|nr:hypothetical protein [Herbinix sp.]
MSLFGAINSSVFENSIPDSFEAGVIGLTESVNNYFDIVAETMNSDVLKEAVRDINIDVSTFVSMYIDTYKKYGDTLYRQITKLLENNQILLTEFKTESSTFEGSFKIKGYNYTINTGIPNYTELSKLEASMFISLNSLFKEPNVNVFNNASKDLHEFFDDTKSKRSKLKNSICRSGTLLEDDKFLDYIFMVHRNMKKDVSEITITKKEIDEIITRAKESNKILTMVKRDKTELIQHLKKMEDLFRDAKVNIVGTKVVEVDGKFISNESDVQLIRDFYNKNFRIMSYMLTNIMKVYVEKLQAVKEMIQQDNYVIQKIGTIV